MTTSALRNFSKSLSELPRRLFQQLPRNVRVRNIPNTSTLSQRTPEALFAPLQQQRNFSLVEQPPAAQYPLIPKLSLQSETASSRFIDIFSNIKSMIINIFKKYQKDQLPNQTGILTTESQDNSIIKSFINDIVDSFKVVIKDAKFSENILDSVQTFIEELAKQFLDLNLIQKLRDPIRINLQNIETEIVNKIDAAICDKCKELNCSETNSGGRKVKTNRRRKSKKATRKSKKGRKTNRRH